MSGRYSWLKETFKGDSKFSQTPFYFPFAMGGSQLAQYAQLAHISTYNPSFIICPCLAGLLWEKNSHVKGSLRVGLPLKVLST